MTPLEIMFVLAVAVVLIVQYLHFNYKLKKERKEKEEYAQDGAKARENYSKSLEVKNKLLEAYQKTQIENTNTIKSWKDASEQKQVLIDRLNTKLVTLANFTQYLRENWNSHLVVEEDGREGVNTYPSIRLTTLPDSNKYSIKTYQGSRDLEGKTDFFFELRKDEFISLGSIISEIVSSNNIEDSDKFKDINNFLKQTNG